MFKSISNNASAEIVEKKSRFIANIFIINSKEEAEKILTENKKKYYNAKHNCYAYIIENIEKFSDDGEPSGTAGAPLLDLLKSKGLKNILIIVTRYFGGILLGTGGLVRAYTESAKKALEKTNIIDKEYGVRYLVEISYSNLQNLEYLCKKIGINIINIDYKVNIVVTLESNNEKKEQLEKSNVEILMMTINNETVLI